MAESHPGDPPPHNELLRRFPSTNSTVLAHFYRGELARSTAWRQKMDQTFHWAILTTTALVSVSFTTETTNHVLLPFGSFLAFLLLNIEGRRYRFFDVWRTRVRMLEVHFIVPAIAHSMPLGEGNWKEVLCNDLVKPSYKMSYWEAVGRRLRRNYIWIFFLLLFSWITKLLMTREAGQSLYDACAVLSLKGEVVIPSWLVVGLLVVFHAFLGLVILTTTNIREATGEIRRRDPNRKVWPI